jgi:hypothetical protein
MNTRQFGWSARIALLVMPMAAFAAGPTLTGDTFVSSGNPAGNFGSQATLTVGAGATSFVEFSLAGLPAGLSPAAISKANLILYANRVTVAGAVSLAQVNGPLSESTATFNTAPPIGVVVAATLPVATSGKYLIVDVTAAVQGALATGTLGFAISPAASAPATVVLFDTKENTTTSHPAILDVILDSGSGGGIGPSGPSGPSGPAGPAGGATGASGPAGAVGATGATGPAGVAGAAGPSGPSGAAGVKGATGATGPFGVAGPAGATGATGPSGPAGAASTVFGFTGRFATPTTTDTFVNLANAGNQNVTQSNVDVFMPAACTFDSLRFQLRTNAGQPAHNYTFRFVKNGVDTALACSVAGVSGGSATCTNGNAVAISAGDTVSGRITDTTGGVTPIGTALFALNCH